MPLFHDQSAGHVPALCLLASGCPLPAPARRPAWPKWVEARPGQWEERRYRLPVPSIEPGKFPPMYPKSRTAKTVLKAFGRFGSDPGGAWGKFRILFRCPLATLTTPRAVDIVATEGPAAAGFSVLGGMIPHPAVPSRRRLNSLRDPNIPARHRIFHVHRGFFDLCR